MKSSIVLLLTSVLSVTATPINNDLQDMVQRDSPDDGQQMSMKGTAVAYTTSQEDLEDEHFDHPEERDVRDIEARNAPLRITISPKQPYKAVILNQHNSHRKNHSAVDLTWDDNLARSATVLANRCVFAHDMNINGGGYGQNLAVWGSTGNIDSKKNSAAGAGITNQWYNGELHNWEWYGQANPPNFNNLDGWGHYTQMVWKNTKRVGCATVHCKGGSIFSMPSWYTVCNYAPQGNWGNTYGANVAKPRGNQMWIVNI